MHSSAEVALDAVVRAIIALERSCLDADAALVERRWDDVDAAFRAQAELTADLARLFDAAPETAPANDAKVAQRVSGVLAYRDDQLRRLRSYRDEYVRNSTQASGAIDAVRLQNYRSFLDRLGEALRQHAQSLELARAEYEKKRATWSEKRVEAESLGRAVDRFRKEERHAADRREQREGDDAAMRVALAARGESGNR